MKSNRVAPYAAVLIRLLQAPLYADEKNLWNLFLQHLYSVQDYFAVMGVEVVVYESDGFAFLHQSDLEDEEGHPLDLPHLTRRDPLPLHTTILCALLREEFDRFEARDLHANRCLISAGEIKTMLLPYFPQQTDERVVMSKIEAAMRRLIEIGFLKPLDFLDEQPTYEIRRIVKARVNADQLATILEKVENYAQ